jgi:hypothetical protein
MDPNAALQELQSWALATIKDQDVDHERAAEVFSALNDWLVSGGFLPNDWSPKTVPTVGKGSNTGHGHAWPRPDGKKARCGGINMCGACRRDSNQY